MFAIIRIISIGCEEVSARTRASKCGTDEVTVKRPPAQSASVSCRRRRSNSNCIRLCRPASCELRRRLYMYSYSYSTRKPERTHKTPSLLLQVTY